MKYTQVLRDRYASLRREKAAKDKGEDTQRLIKTGLAAFDKRAGIERSILTVVGAPTGEGKSIFRKHLEEYTAQRGLKALGISFEDPPEKEADRTFSKLTQINNAKLGQTEFDESELQQIEDALDAAEEWSDNIDYHFGLKTPEECLEIVRDSDADLIQVDYAQAFPEGDKSLERVIAQFAWDLNEHAQTTGCACIVYSQVNKQLEETGRRIAENSKRRGDEQIDISGFRPFGVSDLAWSQALGQRAKGLGFLFRPGRYRKRFGENVKDDRMELIWPKRNFGSEGSVIVGFDGKTASLYDLKEKEAA